LYLCQIDSYPNYCGIHPATKEFAVCLYDSKFPDLDNIAYYHYLLAKQNGTTTGYAIDKLQDRGYFFVDAGEEVYAGQIIAENIKPGDLVVNATEPKKLTNHRASGTDDASRIAPKTLMTLEECMEYIQQDECIEVTPKVIRMRKVILDEDERKKVQKRMTSEVG